MPLEANEKYQVQYARPPQNKGGFFINCCLLEKNTLYLTIVNSFICNYFIFRILQISKCAVMHSVCFEYVLIFVNQMAFYPLTYYPFNRLPNYGINLILQPQTIINSTKCHS